MQQSTNPTGRLLVWLEGSRQKKTLQNFRDYVREHYPWLKLLCRCDCGGRCGEREGAGADAH